MSFAIATPMEVDEVENFLENTAREMEVERQNAAAGDDGRRKTEDRESARDRDRHDRDRGGRDRDRDRNRESNNERHRSRDRDRRRRDDSRQRSSNKGADTDDEGPQRSSRDHRDRSRERYRERERSRDRHRGSRRDDRDRRSGDYYSGGGRARSRSPRRNRDDRYRSDRDRSRDRRRRDDDRPRGGRRTTTPPETEVTEDDRDKRTIFVQQISQRAETRHLRSFFEAVGPVVEAQIVKDRVTGRSKGVGYVEFKDEESVPKAIELTGQKLKGVPIIAQHTEAEKNRASRAAAADSGAANASGAPFHRLYVGNIHFSVTETDLSAIFEPFGELEQVTLQKDENNQGRSKGYGFVQFRDPAAAKAALEQMNGFEVANRPIRVGLGNDKFTPESTASLMRNFNAQAQNFTGSAFSGAGGRGAYAGGSGGVFDRTHGRDDRGVSGASALDDTDVAGININNMNRDRLMNLLARNPVDEPEKAKNGQPAVKPRAPVIDKPMPSRCVKIQNAFDPAQELSQYGAGWIKDLETEVKVECEKKYGKVVHIAVDPNSDGDIFVKFDSVTGGEKALQGLNGRSFNYRSIRASFVVDKIYNSLYGAAANV